MSSDPDCIFCKIIAGDIPSFKLYEDDDTLAFMDINPANEGHALVIPKQHFPDVHAVSTEALTATVLTAKKVAAAVERTLQPGGINLLQVTGPRRHNRYCIFTCTSCRATRATNSNSTGDWCPATWRPSASWRNAFAPTFKPGRVTRATGRYRWPGNPCPPALASACPRPPPWR